MADDNASDDLLKKGFLEAESHSQALAKELGMEIVQDLTKHPIDPDYIKKVPYSFVKKHQVLPLQKKNNKLLVVVSDPLKLNALEELSLMVGIQVKALWCPQEQIEEAISSFYDKQTGAASELIEDLRREKKGTEDQELEVYDLLDTSKEQSSIIRLLNLIITEAIQQGASDIHFEPRDGALRVRYRIDGVLQLRHSPAKDYVKQLIARIKVMAKMDIAEHRLPQDGRVKLKMGRREIDFRVSSVPVTGGERIVMRILDKGSVVLGLDHLGMPAKTYQEFCRLISMPEGIILVTGPTGSGKTTTLYSALCQVYNDETNIMTIEDPVEYNLKGIAQIGVRPKINLNFAAGLRTILRQDPDVIMVGEIRDVETAQIAIQAALTGHLVMSTLHTNDAPSAITRLVDMGVEPYLLSSTVIGVLSQRLVRRLCLACCVSYEPQEAEIQQIGLKREELIDGKIYQSKGCSECFESGFKGRHGIYELMVASNKIKNQIVKSPDAVVLREEAIESGMMTLLKNGAELVKSGITTVAEVLRVCRGLEKEGV